MPPPPMPALPLDVLQRIVEMADTRQLNTLRKVSKRFHMLSNARIERLFRSLVQQHAAELGLAGCPIGRHETLLFRGDDRPPSLIFGFGFTKFNDGMPHVSGEKVKGVVSTSKDARIVRRKYGFKGGYIYALSGVMGIDTLDFNGLEEVATFFVPPECVIAAIGPIAAFDEENHVVVINDPEVIVNPNCRQREDVRQQAREALAQLCRAPLDDE